MGREGEEGAGSPAPSLSTSSTTTPSSPSPSPSSAIPRFFEKTRDERLGAISDAAGLGAEDAEALRDASGGLAFEQADNMVENAIGTLATPLGVATNFVVNGRDVLVPMAIEEPSVIAAASKGAKAARGGGGFRAVSSEAYSIGQIQLLDVADADAAVRRIAERSEDIIALANTKSSTLSKMGLGAKEVSCRVADAPSGRMLIAELLIDVGDAMGANITNSMCEAVAPLLEDICGGKNKGARALLRILSNYSTRRTVRAQATFPQDTVGGPGVVSDMISAFEFADCDVYRAVTHNKGVMNGIIAVANATGQDGRAIEAAAHAYACRTGRYRSLTQWGRNGSGDLVGTIELPMSVGVVGGVVTVHPVARACVRILGAGSAGELACIMASAGLAQNYAAMRALATDGIQKGHMRLHARNLAVAAGAGPGEVDRVASKMVSEGTVSMQGARDVLGSGRRAAG
ncbi:MAG: hydroxymethylglutaryl-CoA reductase, degradative [Thaumarchaeota archaeon]|nr:hydroxymethylglutaryl-CoA reductase, degradative [Nitrososphaerota archaeon]